MTALGDLTLIVVLFFSFISYLRLKLTIFDPILLFFTKELAAVITVIWLRTTDGISTDLYFIFFYVYFSWVLMNFAFSLKFSALYKRKVMQFICSKNFLERKSIRILFIFSVIITIGTGWASFFLSMGGDQRLDFWKAFRVFEPIQFVCSSFVLFYLYKIYNRTGNAIYLLLFGMIIVGAMLSGGKSAILGILPFLNLYYFSRGMRPSLRALISVVIFCTCGVLLSIVFMYGKDLESALIFLIFRIKSDADVYLLIERAYSTLEITSFTTYYLGAFFKVLGLGSLVSENIGAQIGSYYARAEVSTGPNAHLPIIFYLFEKQNELIFSFFSFISIYFFINGMMFYLFINSRSTILIWMFFVLLNYRYNTYFDIASISLYWLEVILVMFFALSLRFVLRKRGI